MAAPQTVARDGDRLVVETKAAASSPSGRIEGVLATGARQGLSLVAQPERSPPRTASMPRTGAPLRSPSPARCWADCCST
ncbi:hypothetical protein AB5I41_11680 [Sphingomonas sp. MMS24-JH45]